MMKPPLHEMKIYAGDHIRWCIHEALKIAREKNCQVAFWFNNTGVFMMPTSDPDLAQKNWQHEQDREFQKEWGRPPKRGPDWYFNRHPLDTTYDRRRRA